VQSNDKLAAHDSTTLNLSNKLEALKLDNTSTIYVQAMLPCGSIYNDLRSSETFSSQPDGFEKELVESRDEEEFSKTKKQGHPCHSRSSEEQQSQNCLESQQLNENHSQMVFYYIAPEETQLTVHAHGACQSKHDESRRKVTFDCIGGLRKQVGLVREMIELPLKHPEMFTNYGK